MNLRPIDHERVLACFHKAFTERIGLWAYGSRIKNTSHDASDLDLVLVPETNQTFSYEQMAVFKALLHDSPIPFLVQVHDWHSLPATYQAEILKNKVVLVGSGNP